jgi:hypothetical protein
MSNTITGVKGFQAKGLANTTFSAENAMKRKILRKAFNSVNVLKPDGTVLRRSMAGPFRTAFTQGDVLNRRNQVCGGANQVNDVTSGILRLTMGGCIGNQNCDTDTLGVTPRQVPLFSGNNKYVSDSSLFTRFKGLESIHRNYNDSSFGGDASNGSYQALNSVH